MPRIPGCPSHFRSLWRRTGRALSFRHSERGQALVEIGFCSVLMLTFVFGAIELSLTCYSYHVVSALAREGARYAMVHGTGFCDGVTPSGCTATTPSIIQTYVRGLGLGMNPSAMTVTSTCGTNPTPPTVPTLTACVATGTTPNYVQGNLVRVVVSYQCPLILPLVRTTTITMTSTSQMVIAQ